MDNHRFALAALALAIAAPAAPPKFDEVAFIMGFEAGELCDQDVVDGFAHLLRSGLCWQLQGVYGRTATSIINMGYLNRDGSHGPNYIVRERGDVRES